MSESLGNNNQADMLCFVPAAGRGSRLGVLTDQQAKPALAIGFDCQGEVKRMIDVPLTAIREIGGMSIVSTYHHAGTLEFIKFYEGLIVVDDEGYLSSVQTMMRNVSLISDSKSEAVGIVPADTRFSGETLAEMLKFISAGTVDAVILGTRRLEGHNARPVSRSGLIVPEVDYTDLVADLGVHVMNREWLLERLRTIDKTGRPDIWKSVYDIARPAGKIALHIPRVDTGWVDMGTPETFRRTIYLENNNNVDAYGNVVFPGSVIAKGSEDTIALPDSTGLMPFVGVIIPEAVAAASGEQVLKTKGQL